MKFLPILEIEGITGISKIYSMLAPSILQKQELLLTSEIYFTPQASSTTGEKLLKTLCK